MSSRPVPARLAAALLLATLLGRIACAAEPAAPPRSAPARVLVDGEDSEWPEGVHALSDGRFVFVRFAGDASITLQGGERSSFLRIDVDDDRRTGRPFGDLGVDLEVRFSPPSPEPGKGPQAGVALVGYGDHGIERPLSHADLALEFAPTYAAGRYELLFLRAPRLPEPWGSRLARSKRLSGHYALAGAPSTGDPPTERILQRFAADLPAPLPTEPAAAIPTKAQGALRIVSWNVEHAGPRERPAAFGRVLRALAPDVLLFQEWWDGDEEEILAFLAAEVPSPEPWRVAAFADLGVAVAARRPLRPLLDHPLAPARPVGPSPDRPVRFCPAEVETSAGPIVVASLHLKARGAASTWEDERRVAEAEAIRAFLAGIGGEEADADPPLIVLGGDWNLVGSRRPLEAARRGLDADGSALEPLAARATGWPSLHTWVNPKSRFTPGRLDYLVVSDARLEASSTFVLDLDHVGEEALESAGLSRADARVSDHLPLVADFVARRAGAAAPPLRPVSGEEVRRLVRRAAEAGARSIVVNFWATWCVPCVRELPDLLRARRDLAAEGVEVLLVSCDFPEDSEKARRLLGRLGVDFPTYLMQGNVDSFIDAVDPEWDGALPATIVYDARGRRRRIHVGRADYDEFVEMARAALEEESSR